MTARTTVRTCPDGPSDTGVFSPYGANSLSGLSASRRPRFPGAPSGSYVCEEGWLVIGEEAWTEAEWRANRASRPMGDSKYRVRYTTETERQAARARSKREWRERQRLGVGRLTARRSAA